MLQFAVCLLFVAGSAGAQYPGGLGMYGDPAGTDCNLYDISPQVVQYHVVHHSTPGARASRFRAPIPTCMPGAFLVGETTMWPIKIGLVQDGTLVGYGGCVSSPIHVMTISIFGQGLSSACCQYPILPDPTGVTGEIEVEGCDGVWRGTWGAAGYVNPTPACYCNVPIEETTWGSIKTLYTR